MPLYKTLYEIDDVTGTYKEIPYGDTDGSLTSEAGFEYDEATNTVLAGVHEVLNGNLKAKLTDEGIILSRHDTGAYNQYFKASGANTIFNARSSTIFRANEQNVMTFNTAGFTLYKDMNANGQDMTSVGSLSTAILFGSTGDIDSANDINATGDVTGGNVTTGADPGHTHTGASLSGIDISSDTNLAVTAPIVLTGDTLSLDQSGNGYVKLADETLAITGLTLDASWTGDYEILRIVVISKGLSDAGHPHVRFNNDTASGSYSWQFYGITGTAVTDSQDSSDDQINLTALADSVEPFISVMDVMNFDVTRKAVVGYTGRTDAVSTNQERWSFEGAWHNTADYITSVKLHTSLNNILAGTRIVVLGIA